MSRRKSRELAFILLFEQSFTKDPIVQIVGNAKENLPDGEDECSLFSILGDEPSDDDLTMKLALGTEEHLAEIDDKITAFSKKWNKDRLSRVTLTLLRLGIFEMLYVDETPVSIAINEAIELAKKYGDPDDAPYVNGVLGAIAKTANEDETV